MMAEAYSLSVWPSCFALESKLSRNLESHPSLVPRLSHHGGKNIGFSSLKNINRLYAESKCIAYAEKQLLSLVAYKLSGLIENVFNVFAFGDFKARSAAMVVMMNDENSFSIRHQQQQRKS